MPYVFGIEREYKIKTIDDNSKMFFVTKIRSATLATKILKNQGLVLKTIGVNFGNIFELGQKNACCINVPNQKMILIYHIGGQNKIRYLYSVFVILYAVRGVGA